MKVEDHLKELLKDPLFRELYALDTVKFELIKKILRYRIKHRLTQRQLAKKVGVSQQQISKIEEGEFSKLATIQKLLRAIGYHLAVAAVPIRQKAAA